MPRRASSLRPYVEDPIRAAKILTAGFGRSRSTIAVMVDAGPIRLPMALDAKAHEDFTLFVGTEGPRFRLGGVTAYARIGRVQARPQDLRKT